MLKSVSVSVRVCLLAALEGSLRAPPLLSDCSLRGAPALLFRAVIGQGPPAELVCSSFVAPRFHSPLKVSLWQNATSAASPSSFTLLRPRIQTRGFVRRLPRPRYHDLELRGEGRGRTGYAHRQEGRGRERDQSSVTCLMEFWVTLCWSHSSRSGECLFASPAIHLMISGSKKGEHGLKKNKKQGCSLSSTSLHTAYISLASLCFQVFFLL